MHEERGCLEWQPSQCVPGSKVDVSGRVQRGACTTVGNSQVWMQEQCLSGWLQRKNNLQLFKKGSLEVVAKKKRRQRVLRQPVF